MSFDQQNKPVEANNEDVLSAFEEVNEVSGKKKFVLPFVLNSMTGIIALSVTGVLLLGTIVFILLDPFNWIPSTEPENPDNDIVDVEDTTVTILDKTNKENVVVDRVDIVNKNDSFSILYNEEEDLFYLDGYTDILLSTDMTDLLQEYTGKLVATDTVSKAENLKDFGLDKPAATATVTYIDGSKSVIYIGDTTPSEDGYYVRTDQDDKVYIFDTDAALPFTYQKTAYVDITLMTSPTVKKDDANGSVVLKEITYKGKNYPQPLVMRRSYLTDSEELALFSYIIEKPYARGTNDATGAMLSSFKSLYAEQALILHPTEKEKAALGFDDPLAVITAVLAVETGDESNEDTSDDMVFYNDITTTITIGNVDKDNYVVMVDGIDAIYLVEKNAFAVANCTYKNSVNTLLFLKNIAEIGKISATIDNKTYDFKLTHYPNKEDSDEQLKVTMDGKVYDTYSFRDLYQILMSLERYGDSDATPSGEPVLTLKVYLTDGTLYMGVSYYPLDGNLCLAKTSEGEVYTTRWSHISHFIKQTNNYLDGEEVILFN